MYTLIMALVAAVPQDGPQFVIKDRSTEFTIVNRVPPVVVASPPLTYAESVALSRRTGKPLVVWASGNFCPDCVRGSTDEFVHVFVPEFPGTSGATTVVGVWEDGEFLRVGDMSWWIVGDATFGHLPSIRRALKNWRTNRTHFFQHAPPARTSSYRMQQSTYSSYQAPMMVAPARRGGC